MNEAGRREGVEKMKIRDREKKDRKKIKERKVALRAELAEEGGWRGSEPVLYG